MDSRRTKFIASPRVGQIKILAEPLFFGVSKFLHVLEAFAAADNGTKGDEEYVGEVVSAGEGLAKIATTTTRDHHMAFHGITQRVE